IKRASLPRRYGVHELLLADDKIRQDTANVFDLRLQTGYGFYFGPVRWLQHPPEQPPAPVHFVRTIAGRRALKRRRQNRNVEIVGGCQMLNAFGNRPAAVLWTLLQLII